jgi:hypothetical protein
MKTERDHALEIMSSALEAARPSALLKAAAEATRKGAHGVHRRKLTRDEAIAAMRAVTAMLKRYGLAPTSTLRKPGRATEASGTYPLFLTDDEFSGAPVGPNRRLNLNVGAHLESVRMVARAASGGGDPPDVTSLLDELAEAIPEFLEPFREEERDPDEEIAEDLLRIGAWLQSPRRPHDLKRFLETARAESLGYDPSTDEMTYDVLLGQNEDDSAPVLPLFSRVVAVGTAELLTPDPAYAPPPGASLTRVPFDDTPLKSLGTTRIAMVHKVGLTVVPWPDKRRLEPVFTIDQVTYVGAEPTPSTPGGSLFGDLTEVAGHIRWRQTEYLPESDTRFRLHAIADSTPDHDDFLHFRGEWANSIVSVDEPCGHRRWRRITPGECRLLLDEEPRRRHAAWFVFGDLKEDGILPRAAPLEGGEESTALRDRLKAALYADGERGLAEMLLAEAGKRERAHERHRLRAASSEQRRKLAFRARMRR